MPMPSRVVEVLKNKESDPVMVEVLFQNETWPLEALPTTGVFTVQFASPGAQVGFNISPGAYGLVGGAAKRGEAIRMQATSAPQRPPIVNLISKIRFIILKKYFTFLQRKTPQGARGTYELSIANRHSYICR